MTVPLVYHPAYNVTAFGLERMHPFEGRKYCRIDDALVARGLRPPGDLGRPRPARRPDLVKLHTPDYLRSLRRPDVLAVIWEVPVLSRLPGWVIDRRSLRPMRYTRAGRPWPAVLAPAVIPHVENDGDDRRERTVRAVGVLTEDPSDHGRRITRPPGPDSGQ